MSHCLRPIVAAKIAVSAPISATTRLATGAIENSASFARRDTRRP
jgi:hypothetical protein